PEADRSEGCGRWQFLDREINLGFVRRQVHVRKDDNAGDRLLGDLRAPARFAARVEALALLKAELVQKSDQIHEMPARAAEGVMIVIAPAQPERILAEFLEP